MIISWKETNVKVVPIIAKSGVQLGTVVLLPGNNDVPDNDWAVIRESGIIDNEIRRKRIQEIHAEVSIEETSVPKKGGKVGEREKKKIAKIKAKSLKELSLPEAEKVISDTYNLDTLKKWHKIEGRDSIRASLQNRIEFIEKYGKEKLKFKKEDEEEIDENSVEMEKQDETKDEDEDDKSGDE